MIYTKYNRSEKKTNHPINQMINVRQLNSIVNLSTIIKILIEFFKASLRECIPCTSNIDTQGMTADTR